MMLRISIALLTLFLFGAWTPSPPVGTSTLFSQSYQMAGTCTGGDMVYRWDINGAAGGGGVVPSSTVNGASFIYPWTDGDITIHGVEITLIPGSAGAAIPAISWLMIGNNADGDAMAFIPEGIAHISNWFPAGTGFQFPGKLNATPLTYIDLHGGCAAGAWMVVMLGFYYTIN